MCAIVESYQYAMTNSGGVIIMPDNPKKALDYAKGCTRDQGTLTWVQYA